MRTISLFDKIKQPGECERLIARFKRALLRSELSQLTTAVYHLQKSAVKTPDVIARLNAAISDSSLSLRWSRGNSDRFGSLLIRNQTVGLVFRDPHARRAEGLVMLAGEKSPFRQMSPEKALAHLSVHARQRTTLRQTRQRALTRAAHLRVVPSKQ